MAMGKDLTKIALEVLKIHWSFSLSFMCTGFCGSGIRENSSVSPNEEKCLQPLAMMSTTVISLKGMRKYFHYNNKDVLKNALQIVLENCVLYCAYLEGCMISKIWNAKTIEGRSIKHNTC